MTQAPQKCQLCKGERLCDQGFRLMSPWDLGWHQLGINSCSSLLASPDPRWLLQHCSAISSVFSMERLSWIWSRPGHVPFCSSSNSGLNVVPWAAQLTHTDTRSGHKRLCKIPASGYFYMYFDGTTIDCTRCYFLHPQTKHNITLWDGVHQRGQPGILQPGSQNMLVGGCLYGPQLKDLRLC